jgi:hypothetical protein
MTPSGSSPDRIRPFRATQEAAGQVALAGRLASAGRTADERAHEGKSGRVVTGLGGDVEGTNDGD